MYKERSGRGSRLSLMHNNKTAGINIHFETERFDGNSRRFLMRKRERKRFPRDL